MCKQYYSLFVNKYENFICYITYAYKPISCDIRALPPYLHHVPNAQFFALFCPVEGIRNEAYERCKPLCDTMYPGSGARVPDKPTHPTPVPMQSGTSDLSRIFFENFLFDFFCCDILRLRLFILCKILFIIRYFIHWVEIVLFD